MDIIKMRYSIDSRDKRYVKRYGFLSFAKNIGENIGKNISNKYSQKVVESPKKSATDAIILLLKEQLKKLLKQQGI